MLSPDQRAELLRVYLATGSYAEAGRAVGLDRSYARKVLKEGDAPQRSALYTRALDAALADATDAVHAAIRANRKDLADAKKRADATFALSDATRTLNQLRTAHAKLTGEHAAERHELAVTTLSDADLDARIRELEGDPNSEPSPRG